MKQVNSGTNRTNYAGNGTGAAKRQPEGQTTKAQIPAVRPMSIMPVMSDKFFDQPVSQVDGKLMKLNRRVLPNLPLKADEIDRRLSVMVNWSDSKANQGLELKGLYNHSRVLSLNVKFADRYGNAYDYLAFKGVGIPKKSKNGGICKKPVYFNVFDSEAVFGMERTQNALHDWECSNLFLRNGMHTTVPVALIKLGGVLSIDGKHVTLDEAVKGRVLPETRECRDRQCKFVPVLYLKGFSEIARVVDMDYYSYMSAANERGLGIREYTNMLMRESARNVAIIHNLGFAHGYLTSHNIAADGAVVDFDSISSADPRSIAKDVEKAMNTLEETKLKAFRTKTFFEEYFKNRKGVTSAQKEELVKVMKAELSGNDVTELIALARK
ncbi:Uncharacterised protein [uncultured archaeon]|nr:Uncharacterised protein [uncultured archaeon]